MSNGLKKIGAAWLKDKKSGDGKYLSATIDSSIPSGSRLMIFRNDYKQEDKHPDYHIFIPEEESEPTANGTAQGGQHSAPATQETSQGPSATQTQKAMAAAPADDIPF